MKKLKFQLGSTLKTLIGKRGISLRVLSRDTGISYSTLHHWLENRTPRNLECVQLLATYLEVSFHFLLFGVEEKKQEAKDGSEHNPLLAIAFDAVSQEGVKLLLDFKIKKIESDRKG